MLRRFEQPFALAVHVKIGFVRRTNRLRMEDMMRYKLNLNCLPQWKDISIGWTRRDIQSNTAGGKGGVNKTEIPTCYRVHQPTALSELV